jgi:cysteine desulfurase/selenocysteine lyase
LFGQKTAFIAVTHTSNVMGTTNDVQSICDQAAAANIPVMIDAAQAMVSNRLNVTELNCAFVAFSAHKMFGPNGIGLLYIAPGYLSDVQPVRLGGGMVDFVAETIADTTWSEAPHCFEAGSPNLPAAVGFAAACDFIDSLDQPIIKQHFLELGSYLYQQLAEFDGLTIVTPQAHLSSGIVSFYHDQIHAHDLAQILGDEGVAVRAGHHCAQPLLQYLNTSSTLRVSCSVYNRREDMDRVVTALRKAEEIFI